MELREEIGALLFAGSRDAALRKADEILAIPEIAEALRITRGEADGIVIIREMTRDEIQAKFGPVRNLGPSVSTGKRDPV